MSTELLQIVFKSIAEGNLVKAEVALTQYLDAKGKSIQSLNEAVKNGHRFRIKDAHRPEYPEHLHTVLKAHTQPYRNPSEGGVHMQVSPVKVEGREVGSKDMQHHVEVPVHHLERMNEGLDEQAHNSYHSWVSDAKQRGAKDFRRPSRSSDHNIEAVTSEGHVVGMWHGKHGGFTHKPVKGEQRQMAMEATWHQQRAGGIKLDPTKHHVVMDPPNDTRSVMTHDSEESANTYMDNLKQKHPHLHKHSYIVKPRKTNESVETLLEMAVPPDEFREFVDAYIAAMLWSETPDGEEDYDKDDIAASTLMRIRNDCNDFLNDEETIEHLDNNRIKGNDMTQAGHDFWLTRVGHGAGFWDGDWDEEAGKYLTARAKHFGHVDLYRGDDGKIYLS